MKTNWVVAPRGDVAARAAGIYASLDPKGKFSIGRVAWQKMGEPQAVNILYDPPNNRLGLKPCARAARFAYPLSRIAKSGRRAAYGYRALLQFGISLPATIRFYDAEIDQDGILILDLRTARVPPSVTNHHTRKGAQVSTRNGSDGGS